MICGEKGAYPSQRRAQDYADKRSRDNRTLDLRVYRCSACGLWHITHVPDRYHKHPDLEAI